MSTTTDDTVIEFLQNKSLITSTIADAADTTKKIAFSAAGNATAVTLTLAAQQLSSQTLTFPAISGADTIVAAAATQTLSGKTISTADNTINVGATALTSLLSTTNPLLSSSTPTFAGMTLGTINESTALTGITIAADPFTVSSAVVADAIASFSASSSSATTNNTTAGFRFTISSTIYVSAATFPVWCWGSANTTRSWGIWDNSGTLVVSTTLTQTTVTTSGYYTVSVTPTALAAGTYYVGALMFTNDRSSTVVADYTFSADLTSAVGTASNPGAGFVFPGSALGTAFTYGASFSYRFYEAALQVSDAVKIPQIQSDPTQYSIIARNATTGGLFLRPLPKFFYGLGTEGNVTFSSNTTLTGDRYIANMTINPGIRVITGGFRIFVSGTLLFGSFNSIISYNGNDGVGRNAGVALSTSAGSLGGSGGGGAGGLTGAAGSAGGANSNQIGNRGGNGGAGSNAAGAAGNTGYVTVANGGSVITANTAYTNPPAIVYDFTSIIRGRDLANNRLNGGGGGGGGSGGTARVGGGGGGGGGVVVICASVMSGPGIIQANGGNGAAGAGSGAGGGGGGGGGIIVVAAGGFVNGANPNKFSATGGSSGASGGGVGVAGVAGNTGVVITFM
jgi:hypothetical protein